MNTASWLTFKAFLNRLPEDRKQHLLHFLSPTQLEKYQALPSIEGTLAMGVADILEQLNGMHYSWFIASLENFSKNDQSLLLSVLDPEKQKKIRSILKTAEENPFLFPLAEQFLKKKLLCLLTLGKKDLLPKELLPKDPLNKLLDFDKSKLIKIIDYLGLYDLSNDLKKVIESSKLKMIQEILKKDETLFLKKIRKEKDRLKIPSIGLDRWDGDALKLRNLIQNRGINRLAKALYFSQNSLLWHLKHKLDTSRAKVLQKYCKETHDEEAKEILLSQVLGIIKEVS